MLYKYKTVWTRFVAVVVFFSIAAHPAFSQQTTAEGSEIIMTPTELKSFIQRIATLKKERMDRMQKERLLNEMELAIHKQQILQATAYQATDLPQVAAVNRMRVTNKSLVTQGTQGTQNDEISDIQTRLDELMYMVESLQNQISQSEYRRGATKYYGERNSQSGQQRTTENGRQNLRSVTAEEEPYEIYQRPAQQQAAPVVQSQPLTNRQQGSAEPANIAAPDTVFIYQNEQGYDMQVNPGRQLYRQAEPAQNTRRERARVVQAPPQTIYLNSDRNRAQQPVVIYRDRQDNQVKPQKPVADSSMIKALEQQQLTQKKINGIEAEIYLLNQLLTSAGQEEKRKYKNEIDSLRMQVSSLTSQLEENKMKTEAKQKSDPKNDSEPEQSMEVKSVSGSISRVYFPNNSTKIPVGDYASLRRIADEMKANPDLILLLRGFASSVGNATYNQQIANRRARSVEEWLIEEGVPAKKIITQGQGVDKSKSEERARRVEISVLSK